MAAKDVTFLSFLFVIDSEDFEGVAKLGVHAAALADSVDWKVGKKNILYNLEMWLNCQQERRTS
jgi:hypothetical protein